MTSLFRFPNLADVRAAMHATGYQFLEDLPPDQRVARRKPEPGHEQLGPRSTSPGSNRGHG